IGKGRKDVKSEDSDFVRELTGATREDETATEASGSVRLQAEEASAIENEKADCWRRRCIYCKIRVLRVGNLLPEPGRITKGTGNLSRGVMVEVMTPPAKIGRIPNLRVFPILWGEASIPATTPSPYWGRRHPPPTGVVGALCDLNLS
ncbi:hypothetical protein CRG98_036010, partial [Punica granatum]